MVNFFFGKLIANLSVMSQMQRHQADAHVNLANKAFDLCHGIDKDLELGPGLTARMVAGRVGAGIAAEARTRCHVGAHGFVYGSSFTAARETHGGVGHDGWPAYRAAVYWASSRFLV